MSEQEKKNNLILVTNPPHYWIYKKGKPTWNKWAEGKYSNDEIKRLSSELALLSLRSSLPLIPMEKDILSIPESIMGFKKFTLQLTRSVQFIISSVLIFLILLGIRNRLRIK